ncbi:MAG: ATP-binding protein [Agathobacter sp.]
MKLNIEKVKLSMARKVMTVGDLADVFQRLGYMERKGSGLTKIIESYKNAYNYSEDKKPQFESSRVEFTVTLMNLNYGVNEANEAKNEANEAKNVTGKIQDIEILLLNILRENSNVIQKELARITGVSRSTIQRLMEEMIKEKKLLRIGATRSGHWEAL